MITYPLGRREAFDPEDEHYPMAAVLPRAVEGITYRYWYAYRCHLNQTGDSCVANAWTHFLTDSPRTHYISRLNAGSVGFEIRTSLQPYGYVSPQSNEVGFRGLLYDRAQSIDEFGDTPPAGGTSVRAGAKALQGWGAIASYHWANSITDIANAVLTTGPVVMGTTWYNNMFNPVGSNYNIDPDTSSGVAGGHAWVVDGVNTETRRFRMKNSWGSDWGNHSFATLSFNGMDTLLSDSGEACIGLEP